MPPQALWSAYDPCTDWCPQFSGGFFLPKCSFKVMQLLSALVIAGAICRKISFFVCCTCTNTLLFIIFWVPTQCIKYQHKQRHICVWCASKFHRNETPFTLVKKLSFILSFRWLNSRSWRAQTPSINKNLHTVQRCKLKLLKLKLKMHTQKIVRPILQFCYTSIPTIAQPSVTYSLPQNRHCYNHTCNTIAAYFKLTIALTTYNID